MLDLIETGVRVAVRIHHAVAVEVAVGGGVFAVVAAVSPAALLIVQALVHPVPDKAALKVRMGIELLPLPVQGPVGVPHGVGVFAQHNGFFRIGFALFPEPVGAGIHGVQEVGIPFVGGPLVNHRAVLAVLFQGFELLVGVVEVYAVAGFVAQGQDGDAGVVGRAAVHVQGTVYVLDVPVGVIAQGFVQVVAHAVALDVGLVVHVKAQGVAEFVELARLGIVAGADGVDVGKAHEFQVFQDVLPGYIVTGIGIVLMQVRALEFHGLAVHKESMHHLVAVGHFLHFQAAETHVEGGVFAIDFQEEGVQFRGFGAPEPYAGDAVRYGGHAAVELEDGIGHGSSVFVQEFIGNLGGGRGMHLELENARGEVFGEGGNHTEVKAGVLGLGREVHIAFYAGDAPEVLIFQIGSGGVAENLEQQFVLSCHKLVRNFIAGQILGILGVTNLLPVDIHVSTALGAAQVQEHLTAFPLLRNGEGPVIEGRRKDIGKGGRLRIFGAEVVGNVGIDGDAPALYFPVAGYLDFVPVEVVCVAGHHHIVHAGDVMPVVVVLEIPGAVEAHIVGALPEAFVKGLLTGGVIHYLRAPGIGVHGSHVHILPVGQGCKE